MLKSLSLRFALVCSLAAFGLAAQAQDWEVKYPGEASGILFNPRIGLEEGMRAFQKGHHVSINMPGTTGYMRRHTTRDTLYNGLTTRWKELEPSPGQYDFRLFDAALRHTTAP